MGIHLRRAWAGIHGGGEARKGSGRGNICGESGQASAAGRNAPGGAKPRGVIREEPRASTNRWRRRERCASDTTPGGRC